MLSATGLDALKGKTHAMVLQQKQRGLCVLQQRGVPYVSPVDRLIPARNAETGALVSLGTLSGTAIYSLSTASKA